MQKDAYYFPHDANARRDRKILWMLSKYEMGYQWYFMTIEILREEKEYKYQMDTISALAYELRTNCDLINSWIKDCIDVYKLFQSDGKYFWSEALITRMQPMEDKREQNRQNANKRWKNEKGTDVMRPNNDRNVDAIQSKVKETKEDENKGEESKEDYDSHSESFTLEDCLSVATSKGYKSEEGEKFYNYYNSQGWKRGTSGLPITDLPSAFCSWINRAKQNNIETSKETWEERQMKKLKEAGLNNTEKEFERGHNLG